MCKYYSTDKSIYLSYIQNYNYKYEHYCKLFCNFSQSTNVNVQKANHNWRKASLLIMYKRNLFQILPYLQKKSEGGREREREREYEGEKQNVKERNKKYIFAILFSLVQLAFCGGGNQIFISCINRYFGSMSESVYMFVCVCVYV